MKQTIHRAKQRPGPAFLCRLHDFLQRHRLSQGKACRLGAPEGGHHPAAAQGLADVVAQRPDVGALGAADAEGILRIADLLQHLQGENGDGPGLALHRPPLPGQVAELLAVHLQGGVHGGHLQNLPPELGQHSL